MASTFRPVNSSLPETVKEEMTSTTATPRSDAPPNPQSDKAIDDAKTPTRASFSPSVAGQKPLPSSPFPPESTSNRPKRDNSQHSAKSSSRRDSSDVEMDDSDGDAGTAEDGAGSDDESVNADGSRSGKKKKSQRFYCTDYPPCNLSFTRSEHLARHIRKHTGERPFQCHCSRRFSRLDNLRQHAQTVHVNEDIPIDSLAATGSRFQRQIRTERVRQAAGNRARAATGGSAGGPVRGHSKSLSTSSITSIGSVGSAYSAQPDPRRRPPPLVMAGADPRDPRSRGSLESYRSNADSYSSYRPPSPSNFSTPTSATFSTGQSSPRWSGFATPASGHSRSQSAYVAGTRTPGRRLSVPSSANPFQSAGGPAPARHLFGGSPINTSNMGAFSPSTDSIMASPTASTASGWSVRRDSTSSAADEAWRRRTWHPDSRNYNGNPNQLSAVVEQSSVRPNPPPPIANPSASQGNAPSNLRLPGIESFDPIPRRPATPPRRNPSPMVIDAQHAPRPHIPSHMELPAGDERRNLNMYDASLQRGLNRLEINPNTPPRDSAGAWASEVNQAVLAQAEHVRMNQPTVRFEDQPAPGYHHPNPAAASRSLHQQTMSAPSITSREAKRHGWYHGPQREAGPPEAQAQVQDPRVNHVERMVHPNFNGFSGFPGRDRPPQPQAPQGQPERQAHANGEPLGRLEALVAVATGEGSTATAY